ncbi:hypothetical protein [Kitasatospora camelliae]|uniref:Uncharacterized protein n=1 Tax=Kitasatospora camelliae TaxID=3156397 RepID=A0AAU8K2M7_9ACTN
MSFPQPVALAVAAEAGDFERLRRHRLFGSADHPSYLRRTEAQLRALRGGGLAVHLRLLDAVGFEAFCAARLLSPGDPAARVAFAADPEYPGDPFVYAGERLPELLPALVGDHRARLRIAAGCAALLAAVGECGERAAALLAYAAELYLALAAGAGGGRHRLELRADAPATTPSSAELSAEAELTADGRRRLIVRGRESEAFCVTLAAVLAGSGPGELLLFSDPLAPLPPLAAAEPGAVELRGWSVAAGRLHPLTAFEVQALCASEEPTGPPPVIARDGFPLPPPPGAEGG